YKNAIWMAPGLTGNQAMRLVKMRSPDRGKCTSTSGFGLGMTRSTVERVQRVLLLGRRDGV
ncbi:hypothetical protein ACWGPP_19650, partial [Agromyces sp. NPDC055657]